MTIQELVKQAASSEANEWMLPLLWSLARLPHDADFGEIGFKNGSSALAMCMGACESGRHVYSMDISECRAGRERIEREGYGDIHTFIHGDSAVVEFPAPLDILFIDGSHNYFDVSRDYERHRAIVRRGGVIIFHDPVSCTDVGKFLDEIKVPYLRLGSGLGLEVVE